MKTAVQLPQVQIKQRVINTLRSTVLRIDRFVFPPLCCICNAPRPIENRWFCKTCHLSLAQAIQIRQCCPMCGQNSALRSCTCSIAWDYPFSRIHSFFDFNDAIKTVMHLIKYRGMRSLARHMGQLCATASIGKTIFNDTDYFIPVPLHPKRLKRRGYNQSEWFLKGITDIYPHSSQRTDILQRTRNTKTQTTLDRSDRMGNVADAFSCNPATISSVNNRNIILVDDVITTGATTASATRTLLAAGCGRVSVLSLARD